MAKPEEPIAFINFYRCTCGTRWSDLWSCKCDDHRSECDTSCSPYRSEDVED